MRQFSAWVISASCACLVLVITGGCSTYHFEITLRPDGEAIERQLTCWKENSDSKSIQSFPRERLQEIASAYSAVAATKLDQKHTFASRFVDKMPSDVGGSGTYSYWASPFGSAAAYLERFGGNDDVAGQIADRRRAVNRIMDVAIGWLETELAREPYWVNLRGFLDTQGRRDLENVSCTLLLAIGAEQDSRSRADKSSKSSAGLAAATIWLRLLQYLAEHGYVEPRELPALSRSMQDGPYSLWLARRVSRRAGLPDNGPPPAALAFLASDQAAKASLERYLRTTPEFRKLERAWQEKGKENRDKSPPEPTEVLAKLFGEAFFKISLEDGTRLKIVVACGEPPTATNGNWDAESRQVSWQTAENGPQGLPTFVYAMWSTPTAEAQQLQFGQVALSGEGLYSYVLWYRGLSQSEMAEWDAFLATVRPGRPLRSSLAKFRFSSDPPLPSDPKQSAPKSLADEARRLILEGLSAAESRP